jgi:HD-GYP domain-containing protein (c-di-GMP phosphodiesterase class II)
MTLRPSFEDQELLADNRRRDGSGMSGRELVVELSAGMGIFAAAAVLWWLWPPHAFAVGATVWSMVIMVLATRVSFETPFGFTVATQLAFVPLLFAMPVAVVPLAVVVCLGLARLPDVLVGDVSWTRLLRTPGNAWFAVGPSLLFVLIGVAPRDASLELLIAALAAQFAVDFAVSAVRCRLAREATIRAQLRDSWVYLIDAALSTVGLVVAKQMELAPYAVLAVVPLLGLLAMFANERQGRLGSLLELNDTYRGAALLLGDVIAADDGYTGEHSEGVVGLALAVGDELGFDPGQRRNLEFGAMLHDIGKIAIPKEIINKPGKLDPEEWKIIKTHPGVGEQMLNRVGGFMREVGQIVRHHHERWDGGGYPDGVAGDAIPLASRIISCCDAWSAMRTDRPYRKTMSFDAAQEQMTANAGAQFDPAVTEAMLRVVCRAEAPAPAAAAAAEEHELSTLSAPPGRPAAAVEGGRASARALA